MVTPYDWQEGIGNRAQYIEGKLAEGAAVIGVSIDEGILFFTYRRQARKIFEIYDRLIFGAVGQQSDVEALRTAAVDFAHQEGYNRSEEDVTIQRVVTALSTAVKKAFGDFTSAPVVARSLFGEVSPEVETDLFYVLDFDGDFHTSRRFAVAAGTEKAAEAILGRLASFKPATKPEKAVELLKEIWLAGVEEGERVPEGYAPEAVLLSRKTDMENRFRVILREEI